MAGAICIAVLYAIKIRSDLGFGSLPQGLIILGVWIVIVSLVWGMIHSSAKFLMDPLFWIYNILVMSLVIVILKKHERGEQLIGYAVLAALAISALGAMIGLRDPTGRNTGFFNNPNQLAYFSICAIACLVVLKDFKISRQLVVGFILGGVGLLSAASLGAIAGALFLILALLVANARSVSGALRLPALAAMVIAVMLLVDGHFGGTISDTLQARFNRADSKITDMYTERNYERIVKFPEHALLGAGSALHEERFSPYGRNEIHSSFGALLFNYGVVGLLLFVAFLVSVLRKASAPLLLSAAAPLLYSVTHMGLRFTTFWILMAIILFRTKSSSRQIKSVVVR